MKKFLSILIAISLVQVGISYAADPATDLENRDYIFGTSKNSDVNLNQVLFLLLKSKVIRRMRMKREQSCVIRKRISLN